MIINIIIIITYIAISYSWDDPPAQVCQLKATRRAFAARRRDGRVVCWGDAAFGADAGHVEVPRSRSSRSTQGASSMEQGEKPGKFERI